MILTNKYFQAFIITSFLMLTSSFKAEQMKQTDGYNIHYNAFNSAMLTPEIAKQYNIQRSSSLGVINISVLNTSDKAVTAFIEGHAKNNLSQLTKLKFRKVIEGPAIYYIAIFNFTNKENITFNFYVVPEGETHNTKVSFSQQFFVG